MVDARRFVENLRAAAEAARQDVGKVVIDRNVAGPSIKASTWRECAVARPTDPAWGAAVIERNWLVYRLVRRDAKPAKHPAGPDTGGAPISVHDAARLTFDEAETATTRLGPGFGVGYLPRPDSVLIGIDLDNCIRPWDDEPDDWVIDLLARQPGSGRRGIAWIERSPSGTGLRILAERKGSGIDPDAPVWMREANGLGYYGSDARFFTVTLDALPGTRNRCLWRAPDLIAKVLDRLGYDKPICKPEAEDNEDTGQGAAHWFDQLSEQRQLEEVERMLSHLTDPEFGDYELWLKISFAVYRATDSMGFEIWDAWCQRLPGYNAAENTKKWETSFYSARPDQITVGTLIMHAKNCGFQLPSDATAALRALVPEELARINALARAADARRKAQS